MNLAGLGRSVARKVAERALSVLGDAAAWPVQGLIRHFRPEMEARIADYSDSVKIGTA